MKDFSVNQIARIAIFALLPVGSALADGQLTPVDAPATRPYPYKIQELQPGMPLEDITARFAELSADAPTRETRSLRVQSPEGAAFEFSFQDFLRIGDIGMQARMANMPQDSTTAFLATEVLGKRPMVIERGIQMPAAEMPELLELKAQIEGLYGPASLTEIDSMSMTLTYAWGEDGFIPDLMGQPPMPFEIPDGSMTKIIDNYQPCVFHTYVDSRVQVDFAWPRRKPLMPGCIATYKVTYNVEQDRRRIGFILTDYELGRLHREELDRQILNATENPEVKPSNLDL
ncbi:hypothetical protein [Paracoccus sp. (in: a-proteobacteria)]|uniref:hypothetical protein n=1 Tax=Paracoccus sp. TaxID=267 RepID=UPI0028A6FCB9|nr:hypothetical protein [Paracoccus sp. (in: a-proteobacteria)]